jgi:acetyl esterase/lipase
MSLRTDPRTNPAVADALAPFGLDQNSGPAPVTPSSPREELLEYASGAEAGFEAVFGALMSGIPPVQGIASETRTTTGADGNEIKLYVTRPESADGPLPCIYHVHGGGMVIIEGTGASYSRWREELAATGLVVVGVEFRNGAGSLGPHPFPAGLEDCASGLKWVNEHLAELGVSNVVISGDSGGANLTLALAIKAKREGFLDVISGVYAQCPYIYGKWADRTPEFPSLAENDGYFLNRDMLQVLAEIYDPGSANIDEPTCWPTRATAADLKGLPPHVISVNEVDPLRDEGLDYYRKLLAAGVRTVGRMNLGVSHVGETMFRATMPEVYQANIRDISGFARSLT